MDLNKEWEKIQKEKFSNQSTDKTAIMEAIKKESTLTIYELKKRLKYKLNWIVFFLICFSIAAFYTRQQLAASIFFLAFFIVYLIGYIAIYRQYTQMETQIDPQHSMLQIMKNHLTWMKKALAYERFFGYVGIPLLFMGGFLLPDLMKGANLPEVLSDTRGIIIMLISAVIVTPLVNWAGNKMNKYAYGTQMEALASNIKKLESQF